MSKIGLIVIINKFKHYFESSQTTFTADSVDDIRDQLINYLAKELSILNIDYPQELTDFDHYWFGQQYVNTNSFYYKIFNNGIWSEPWEYQEVYSDILDKMLSNEQSDPPKFDEIYGEPDPDEEIANNFKMENDEQIHELEKKLTEIIKESKNVHFKEDQIKECKCNKCVEGHEINSCKEFDV